MPRPGDLRVRLFVAAVVVEVAIALALRLGDVLAGPTGNWVSDVSLAGLGWLVVLMAALGAASKHVGRLTREVSRGSRAIVEHAGVSHEWVWECSLDLIWTYCGPRVTDYLGYTPEALAGHSMLALLPADDAHRMREMVADATEHGGWRDVELRWRHADGRLVLMQDSASPVVDERGRVVGFRGSRRPVPFGAGEESRRQVERLLAERRLGVALQPIVHLASGNLVGAEALARFDDQRPPDVWFRLAREAQMTVDLERLTLEVALETASHLPADAYLSVNASPELVLDPQFTPTLTGSGVRLDRLVVEITEHAEVRTYDDLARVLQPLRHAGLRVAVDDAGAGYASFHHVLRLRPDIIKVDRSLISNLTSDPPRRALITAIVLVALELQAGVTAEGVETPSELETIASLGVDAVQGFLLARPSTDPERWSTWSARNWLEPVHTMSAS